MFCLHQGIHILSTTIINQFASISKKEAETMGKAKIPKKPATPVKISTSLFHQRKAKHSSSDSSTDSSSVPSPKLTKKKPMKVPKPQPKAKPKTPGVKASATTKAGVTQKKEKGESKKKAGTKAKEKPKRNEDSKGVKGNQIQGKSKSKEKTKKDKSVSPKPKRKAVARRSQSSNSDSSSSSTDEDSSSRTRSPSPPRKTGGGKKGNSPVPKSKSSPKKVPRKDLEKKSVKTFKEKGAAALKKRKIGVITKKENSIKGKGKQTKPKGKLKRMASLNAKAILEASFSFEAGDKKRSPAGTPIKSPKSSGTNQETPDVEPVDLKPLTLLFSSVTETDFPKESASPKGGERKRKSSSSVTTLQAMTKANESSNRRESNASNGNHSQLSPKRRESESLNPLLKREKEKSKSPGPKKKAKVTSSSVSTSTSPFEPIEDLIAPHHLYEQHRTLPIPSSDDIGMQRHFTLSAFHSHHNLHSEEPTNHFIHHSPGGQKGRVTQTKEKSNSATPTPTNPFGSTVYQPAGPLIEPHKTATVPVGLLPDTVRIPSDLKVTYQTRPPSSTVLTVSTGNQSSKAFDGVNRKYEGRHGGSKTMSTSTSTQRSQSKQILHQPYKSTTESSSSSITLTTMSTKQPQPTTFIHSPLAVNSTFSAQAAGSLMMSSGGSGSMGGVTGTLTQAAALPSHIHPSSTIMATGASASPGSLYFGYGSIHQSPFSPSKYPIVPPDSYRAPSPYLYAPTTPQPPPNYFMTPSFYSAQTLGQPPGTNAGISIGNSQPRPLFAAHHHPSAGGSSVTGAPFYQPPPSAHPVSNYYVTAPPLQPSHHSMQPSTAPGHAGPSHPNPSSQPACPCPTVSSPRNSNSISNNNNSTNTTNNNKTNRSLLRKLPQQLPAISVTLPVASVLADVKPVLTKPQRARIIRNNSQLPSPLPLSILRLKSNKVLNRKTPSADFTQVKQLENAKTFTEQYSLPDDITITPIIMNTTQSNALPFTTYGTPLPLHKVEKKKDIVHVIDTRSGESTTIAKHISINNIHRNSLTQRNVSSVKPNNAGNVGKISPSLDVIVLSPERKQIMNKATNNEITHIHRGEKLNYQRAALLTSPVHNTLSKPVYPIGKSIFLSNANTNLVQPLLQPLTKNENKAKAIRRKGLTLNECIDGLQRKKMRILADTNVSITNVTPPFVNSSNSQINSSTYDHHQLTIVPTSNSHGHGQLLITNNMDARGRNQVLLNQKSNRKDVKPKQRAIKSLAIEPSRRQSTMSKRTTSTESDFGTKLIDCNAAVAAVSALVIPSPPSRFEPDTNSPPITPYSLHHTGMNKRQNEKKKASLKIKLYKSEEGKITTRSTTQNSKVKTRGNKLKSGSKEIHFSARGRSRLLIRDKDGSKSDSSGSLTPNFLPYYHQTQGNGSSTLTTSNNHVILRIPKTSGERLKSEVHSRVTPTYPVSSGNMTLNAMKKRAIVKPLSPSLINGALHSLAMSNKKLPIHTHPRWSNGWRFEGKAFEAKVYIKNDDNPVLRRCYPVMRHDGGDVIRARDCVLLKSGPRKTDLPFVAKVAALFENPADGEMMFSLLWYYRPEHTDIGRNREDMPDEIFASKHRDSNSVATIEDKCYVFTFNEYCRYKKRLKQLREGVTETTPIVPLSKNQADTRVPVTNFATDIANAVWFGISTTLSARSSSVADETLPNPTPPPPPEPPRQPTGKISPEVVFFCRKVYDYRQKRMLKNPS